MQSKKASLVEQFVNVGSGYITAFLLWSFIVVPVWDIEMSWGDNFAITGLFTIVSIIRGYFWRRLFNKFDF